MVNPELIVDIEADPDKKNAYYLTPENLIQLKYIKPNSFSKATIRNTNVTYLTGFILQCLFTSLVKGSSATIVVDEPVLVLQDYDANTIEANAGLAGFKDIRSSTQYAYCPGLGTKVETIALTLTK